MALSNKESYEIIDKMISYYTEIEMFIKGMEVMEFHNDIKTVRAVTNNILQIGELSKKLDKEFKQKYSKNINWVNLRETRNLLAHDSENVSHKRLWDTATYDLRSVNSVLLILRYELKLVIDGVLKTKKQGNVKVVNNGDKQLNNATKNSRGMQVKKPVEMTTNKTVAIRPNSITTKREVDYDKYAEYEEYDFGNGRKTGGRRY